MTGTPLLERLDALDRRLLDDFQSGIPLAPRPFALMAEQLGVAEAEVIARLQCLTEAGAVSRVGPVFRPRQVGASTLAAMAVPPERLAEVATLVNGFPEVNHNYERENRFNLWFVAVADDEQHLRSLIAAIEAQTGYPAMLLPMLADYFINLGFEMNLHD